LLRSAAARLGLAARDRLAAVGLAAAIAIAHPLEQTAALVLTTATGRLTANRGRLAASGGAATALAAKQAGGGFLILAHHGETNHGHQHGDRPQNDTIHLDSSHVVTGNKKARRALTVEDSLCPLAASTVTSAAGSTQYWLLTWVASEVEARFFGGPNLGEMQVIYASVKLGRPS
jgi:hypothetical protein